MLVSVIIPTFNRQHKVMRAVESALAQSYPRLEVIVVDDGSTDCTLETLRRYEGRITVLRQANRGPSAARNAGIAASNGQVIAFLDSDDLWLPQKIERQVQVLEQGGERMICCVCNSELTGLLEGKTGTSFARAGLEFALESGWWLNPSRVLATRFLLFNQVVAVRREALEQVGGFREDLRLLEDHDLAFRLALLGPWGFIRTPLVVKYNEADGIGVRAMGELAVHAEARRKVLESFLSGELKIDAATRRLLSKGLREVRAEMAAAKLANCSGRARAALGGFWRLVTRARQALRRRSPLWPRTEEAPLSRREPDLSAVATA